MRCRIRYSVKIGAADNAYAETFNKQFLLRKIDLNRSKLFILCNQPDFVAFPAETFDRNFLTNTRDNNLTVVDILGKAVVVTDAFSCVVLILGAAIICISGLSEVGGVGALKEAIASKSWTQDHLTLLPPVDHSHYPWPAVVLGLGFVLGPAYWMGNQAIVQRTLGTRSAAEARASCVF